MMRAGAIAVLLAALAASNSSGAESARGHSLGAPVPVMGKLLRPNWSPISPQARIFLVAGARDSANFAQEIVDQKKYWLARGYSKKQIECFFVMPYPPEEDDAEQFQSLEADLVDCHLAAPDIVLAALAKAAERYRSDFFYLYVSSHGTDPVLNQRLSRSALATPDGAWFASLQGEARAYPQSRAFQWFSPYLMEIEGAGTEESWGWISLSSRLENGLKNTDIRVETQLFTPKHLAAALQAFPEKVKKYVVLQACHSGGFLLPPEEAPAPEETLVNVKNITVLTASRADRTSFGCDTSEHTTYYGGSLQSVLDTVPARKIPDVDWKDVHEQIAVKVQQLELDKKIGSDRLSLPQYFSNIPAKKR